MSGTVIQMQQQQPVAASTLDGLPKQFVTAMRTLFDIMDDKRNGCVNFADIENRWQDDGSKGLPKGVIESLRKVTPPNGLLSFERFCAGLKICLLRNQVEQRNGVMGGGGGNRGQGVPTDIVTLQQNRPPSAPLLDLDSPPPLPQSTTHPALINTKSHHNSHHNNPSTNHNNNLNKPPWTNTATIRPNINTAQRTLSMPQLVTDPHQLLRKDVTSNVVVTVPVIKDQQQHTMLPSSKPVPNVNKPVLYGPPKPPRTTLGALDRNNPTNNVMIDRTEIRNALQNWQLGLMEQDSNNKAEKAAAAAAAAAALRNGLLRTGRSLGDGSATQQQQQGTLAGSGAGPVVTSDGGGAMQMTGTSAAGMYQKKANVRRREPRRHTLQNGIDYNMLKRMKQIEQEKEVLLQGLGAIEKAREWYMKQVAAVQDRMKYIGRMGHVEHWSEAQQERLELQRARVYEVNRHLAALTDSWERGGLPLHMNLAVQHYQHHSHPPQDLSTRLKQQNHLLTEEVGKKSERISVLEREKQSLIRELLQMRVPNRNSQEEAVF